MDRDHGRIYSLDELVDWLDRRFDRLDHRLDHIELRLGVIMADLTRITSEVTEIGSASQSAVVLLGQLAELIRANATDEVALNALADQLDAEGNALAAAVVANTPAEG